MDNFQKIAGQLHEQWQGWTVQRQLSAVLVIAVCMTLFGAMVYMGTREDLVPLMTNLAADDANEIAGKLQAQHIPFQVTADGGVILVPADQVHAVRLKLAGEGLPKGGGVGFELFNDNGLGMSNFAEQINYRRALEGELRRTIRTMGGVRDARVHIVVPKPTVFRSEEQSARASVTLNLVGGRRLDGEQVKSIVHLVASAVEGLSPDNVTVVDTHGAMLSRGGDAQAALDERLRYQRTVENGLEQRVIEILERALGPNSVSVRVSAEIDYTATEKMTEEYDPDSSVVRSEQLSEEQARNAQSSASGVPGVRSNVAGGAPPNNPLNGNETKRQAQTRNYEFNKVTSKEVGPLGRLARLSVAVVVDGQQKKDADGKSTSQSRTAEELERIKELVKKSVGYDLQRGDQVEVQNMAFAPVEAELPPNETWTQFVPKLGRPMVAMVGLLLLALILRPLLRRESFEPQVLQAPRTVREIEAAMEQRPAFAPPPVALGKEAPPALALGVGRPDPIKAAGIVKGWLSES